MRTSHPDETQLVLLVFDLLYQDRVDLRGLPLSERKRDLHRLCVKSKSTILAPSADLSRRRCLARALVRGRGVETLVLALRERPKPELDEDKVS